MSSCSLAASALWRSYLWYSDSALRLEPDSWPDSKPQWAPLEWGGGSWRLLRLDLRSLRGGVRVGERAEEREEVQEEVQDEVRCGGGVLELLLLCCCSFCTELSRTCLEPSYSNHIL